jgi:hypothetical protein
MPYPRLWVRPNKMGKLPRSTPNQRPPVKLVKYAALAEAERFRKAAEAAKKPDAQDTAGLLNIGLSVKINHNGTRTVNYMLVPDRAHGIVCKVDARPGAGLVSRKSQGMVPSALVDKVAKKLKEKHPVQLVVFDAYWHP